MRERYVAEEEARLTALDAKKKADRKKALQDQKEYAQRHSKHTAALPQRHSKHTATLPLTATPPYSRPSLPSLPPTLHTGISLVR